MVYKLFPGSRDSGGAAFLLMVLNSLSESFRSIYRRDVRSKILIILFITLNTYFKSYVCALNLFFRGVFGRAFGGVGEYLWGYSGCLGGICVVLWKVFRGVRSRENVWEKTY